MHDSFILFTNTNDILLYLDLTLKECRNQGSILSLCIIQVENMSSPGQRSAERHYFIISFNACIIDVVHN